jgi:hypothetical protein
MNTHLVRALLLLALPASPVAAADLTLIPRTLRKEPAYQATPRYCLLVFGLEAKTRIWLVLDGDVLYADLNGNGDITEPGEQLKLPAYAAQQGFLYSAYRDMEIGSIRDGDSKHEKLQLMQWRVQPDLAPQSKRQEQLKERITKDPDFTVCRLQANIEWRPRRGDRVPIFGRVYQWAGEDIDGWLQFADRPANAPIVHFAGPLSMGLDPGFSEKRPQKERTNEMELAAAVGTPGLGQGT